MSFDSAVASGLTRCLFCSLGCRAGLGLGGPEQYVPAYPEAEGDGYAGLCARGSMFAELTNHRQRLLWPMVRQDGAYQETAFAEAVRGAGEALRAAAVGNQARVFIDGNFDLASLAQAVAAVGKLMPGDRVGIYLPQADAELLAGCETSGATYVAPQKLKDADAILIVGNAFVTHPVVAHWVLDLEKARGRRPLMVLDCRSGVTAAYATSATVVPAGCEHVALAAVGKALGVRGCDAAAGQGIDAAAMQAWAGALSKAERPAVLVAAEFGRAARWFEIGLLAGQIAKAAGGALLPLTVYGNALGAVRLAEKLGLADCGKLGTSTAGTGGVTLALGPGMAERVAAGGGQLISAASLAPRKGDASHMVLPLAWAFETGGPVLLPGQGLVASEAAIRPPAGVPTLGRLAADLAGGAGAASSDFASLGPAGRKAAGLDLSPLAAAGGGEGLVVVLAADSVNFADGTLTRRVSFPAKALPGPTVALSLADAARLGVADGHVVRLCAAGVALAARVEIEEGQRAGQAVLSGAYVEAQRLVAAARGDELAVPVRVAVEPA